MCGSGMFNSLLPGFRLRTKAPHFLVMSAYGLGKVHTSSPSPEMNEVKGVSSTVDVVCFVDVTCLGLFLPKAAMQLRLPKRT